MATVRKAPGDVTGRSSALLTEKHHKELAARAGEIAVLNAVAVDLGKEVVDVVIPKPPTRRQVEVAVVDPEAPVEPVEVDQPEETVLVQLAEDITDMTWGAGNLFTFKAGQRVNMPRSMAVWLSERGYIWGNV